MQIIQIRHASALNIYIMIHGSDISEASNNSAGMLAIVVPNLGPKHTALYI